MKAAAAGLNISRCGEGPPLLLLHGWGMNLAVFEALAACLARDFRVTTVDLPGHGASDWPARGSAASLLEPLHAALQSGALPRDANLVGWSLGGQLALWLAAERSHGVRRLVLLSATARFVADGEWECGLAPATVREFSQGLALDPRQTLERFLALVVRGGARAAEALEQLRGALEQHGHARPEALAAGLEWLIASDLRALAASLDIPALVIGGANDRITLPGATRALAQTLPQARWMNLARAGHAPFLPDPTPVADAIRGFVTT